MIKQILSIKNKSGTSLRIHALLSVLSLQFGGYMLINYFSAWRADTFGHYLEPWTVIDYAIPYVPFSVIPYLFLIPLMASPLFIFIPDEKVIIGVHSYFRIIISSFIVFLIIPMKMDRSEYLIHIPDHGIIGDIVKWVWYIDPPYNTFPSLHVSLACIATFIICKERKVYRATMIISASILILSIFYCKQHFIIDAIGGIVLAWIWFKYYYLKKSIVKKIKH